MLVFLCGSLAACQTRQEDQQHTGTSQNVASAPAMTTKPTEVNPAAVATTDQPQTPAQGRTEGTVPNVSPGKNDAPSPDYVAGPAVVPGAQQQPSTPPTQPSAAKITQTKETHLSPIKGSELAGDVDLQEFAKGVRVTVTVKDAIPGKHGVHIDERGDCSDVVGGSTGEHFAPTGHDHGLPGASNRHFGDLGNLTVAQDGTGTLDIVVPGATLKAEDRLSLLGRALVVSQSEDLGDGPNGHTGTPIACASIP